MLQRLLLILPLLVMSVMPAANAEGVTGITSPSSTTTTVFVVQNLSCSACLVAIGSELRKEKGWLGIDADLKRGLVAVRHRPPLTESRIAALMTKAGYPAVKAPADRIFTGQQDGGATGAGCLGCTPSSPDSPCAATASAWQRLFEKIFGGR